MKLGESKYSDGNGVHINTAEAEFSVLLPWIATFRGVSKEKLYPTSATTSSSRITET